MFPCFHRRRFHRSGLSRRRFVAALAAVDSERPSGVWVHGFNPFPNKVHFTLGEAAVASGWLGRGVNLLEWDWNRATRASMRPKVNVEAARGQGERLAASLIAAGIAPGRTELIGHSLGCVLAAAAARSWSVQTGERVARVTLLEPLRGNHEVIFDVEQLASNADRVENHWSPGPSGFGAPAARPDVVDVRRPGRTPIRGLILPHRSNHVDVLRQLLPSEELFR